MEEGRAISLIEEFEREISKIKLLVQDCDGCVYEIINGKSILVKEG